MKDGTIIARDGSRLLLHSFFELYLPKPESDKVQFRERLSKPQAGISSVLSGLYRTNTPIIYFVVAKPVEKNYFEYSTFIGSWAECKDTSLAEAQALLEQQMRVIATAVTVAMPDCNLKRLAKGKAAKVIDLVLSPPSRFRRKVEPEELEQLISFESSSNITPPTPQFHIPSENENTASGIPIARIIVNEEPRQHLYLEDEDLSKHVCILGMTGSGKTTTAMTLAKRLNERGIPFLVLDIHNEYGDFVRSIGGSVEAPGRGEFTLNPLEDIGASSLAEHAAIVSDIFCDIYHFTSPQSYMFRNSIIALLSTEAHLSGLNRDLSGLLQMIDGSPIRSQFDNETKMALVRRLAPLTEGQAGRALCGRSSVDLKELLSKPTVIELGYFREFETRTLFSSFLLKAIHDYRLGGEKSGLRHAIIIEEARNLVPVRKPEEPVAVSERLSQDMRKFGESVVYIAQFPSQISPEVLKNTGVRIVHRVSWNSDIKVLGDAMNLTEAQAKYMSQLQTGYAIINVAKMKSSVLAKVVPDEELLSVLQKKS
ncbi:MAG: ATP-binding protein [Conexivisphaerales archaeon]